MLSEKAETTFNSVFEVRPYRKTTVLSNLDQRVFNAVESLLSLIKIHISHEV